MRHVEKPHFSVSSSFLANNNAVPSPVSGHDDFVLVPSNLPEDPMANSPYHPSSQQQQQQPQQQRPRSSGPTPGSGVGVGGRTPVRRIGSKEMLAAAPGIQSAATPSQQGSPQTPTMLRRQSRNSLVTGGSCSPSPTPSAATPSPPTPTKPHSQQQQQGPARVSSTPPHGTSAPSSRGGAVAPPPMESKPIPVPSQVEAFKQMERSSQQRRASSVNSVSSASRGSLVVSPTPPPLPASKPPALPPKGTADTIAASSSATSPTSAVAAVALPSPVPPPISMDPPNVQFFLGNPPPPVAAAGKLRRHSSNFGNLSNNNNPNNNPNVGLPQQNGAPTLRRSGEGLKGIRNTFLVACYATIHLAPAPMIK